jgi:3'(2'), 5'-bisphosphate nucleotidase
MTSIPELLDLAITAALEAGSVIMDVYESEDFDVAFKSDHSPLTKADKAAHDVIIKHLSLTELPILSEEGSQIPYTERVNWNYFWLVDPLDGTKEFIKRNGSLLSTSP